MGCGNCGVATEGGKPSGCQSNGGCSSGGCNRLNVFNWLADIPLSDFGKPYDIVEVSFNKGSRKDYFRNTEGHLFHKGEMVAVEGVGGFDVGEISLTGELVKLQLKKYSVKEEAVDKKILRSVTDNDLNIFYRQKESEKETLIRSRAIAKQLNLEMKIAEAEWQADGKKVTFFYTADARVDFRELIKVYASEFKAKIEMRQIGARQESAKVGGIGSCGRELCCSTWLSDFKTVNTTAARYQNLSINQTKLSGQCGRLKCCLNYELDTYMDALKGFPQHAEVLELEQGRANLQKKDIFRNLMWYSFAGSNKQYPLTIERVREIMELNANGIKPAELEAVEVQASQRGNISKVVEMGFVNDVGQIQLSSLKGNNNNNKKKKKTNKPANTATAGVGNSRPRPEHAKAENRNSANRPQQKQANASANNNRPNREPKPAGEGNAVNSGNKKMPQTGPKPQHSKPQQKQNVHPNAAADAKGKQGPTPHANKGAHQQREGGGPKRKPHPKPNRAPRQEGENNAPPQVNN
jgi:cell fate regulator YaaT (PSP1 superfamily)